MSKTIKITIFTSWKELKDWFWCKIVYPRRKRCIKWLSNETPLIVNDVFDVLVEDKALQGVSYDDMNALYRKIESTIKMDMERLANKMCKPNY